MVLDFRKSFWGGALFEIWCAGDLFPGDKSICRQMEYTGDFFCYWLFSVAEAVTGMSFATYARWSFVDKVTRISC